MEPVVFEGAADFITAKGSKIYTHTDLNSIPAGSDESGLTLMQFRAHAGREMRVDFEDMDRFVNHWLSRDTYMLIEYMSDRFTFRALYKDLLEWLHLQQKTNDKIAKVWEALLKKVNKTSELKSEMESKMSLLYFHISLMHGEDLTDAEKQEFVNWKLAKLWRSQYADTAKLKIPGLLKDYMAWAKVDEKLKDNVYVLAWHNSNNKKSEICRKLVEGLNQSWWHWRSILRVMQDLWEKFIKMTERKHRSDRS
ncbi:hypothetical protein MJO29_013839 [Puccinia striiformis f. sp. tritici]|nr:hypothetical protein MJO29_013839 [Puccinia striiformis f. sp. tritici]